MARTSILSFLLSLSLFLSISLSPIQTILLNAKRYAGDYREGIAVVREKGTGLCHHVDLQGKRIYEDEGNHTIKYKVRIQINFVHLGFLDLDVYHKGYARAKDSHGWFHVDTNGYDISNGKPINLI